MVGGLLRGSFATALVPEEQGLASHGQIATRRARVARGYGGG